MVKQLKYIGANSLFALFVFLLLPFVANAETLMAPDKEGEVISWLTQQYKEYWLNEDIHRTETMNEKYLTPAMLAKVYRASNVVDANLMTRSQDVTSYAARSVSCRHLDGDWYAVSWRFSPDGSLTDIPVRVTGTQGNFRIAYVTPFWGGTKYGDSLFEISRQPVDQESTAEHFVRSFYERYLSVYILMPDTLEQELSHLRSAYCAEPVLQAFDKKRKIMQRMDGTPSYDLLVGESDFDAFWKESFKIRPMDDRNFEVSYAIFQDGRAPEVRFRVQVGQQGGKYLIEKISDMTQAHSVDGREVCTLQVEDSLLYDYQPEFADDMKLICLHFLKWPEGYPSDRPLSAEIRFTIGADGDITDVVLDADSPEVKSEIERMFSSLPKALPAWQDGKAVASTCVLRLHMDKSEWERYQWKETETDSLIRSGRVHVNPEFPASPSDGLDVFRNYLGTLLPEKSSGKLLYSFVVKKDGRMSEITCVRNFTKDPELEKKVTKALTTMGEKFRWHPASAGFVFMDSKFSIPITLK
mgnify:CR=1 FL=1